MYIDLQTKHLCKIAERRCCAYHWSVSLTGQTFCTKQEKNWRNAETRMATKLLK